MSRNKDIDFLHAFTGEPYSVCRRRMKACGWNLYQALATGGFDLSETLSNMSNILGDVIENLAHALGDTFVNLGKSLQEFKKARLE